MDHPVAFVPTVSRQLAVHSSPAGVSGRRPGTESLALVAVQLEAAVSEWLVTAARNGGSRQQNSLLTPEHSEQPLQLEWSETRPWMSPPDATVTVS